MNGSEDKITLNSPIEILSNHLSNMAIVRLKRNNNQIVGDILKYSTNKKDKNSLCSARLIGLRIAEEIIRTMHDLGFVFSNEPGYKELLEQYLPVNEQVDFITVQIQSIIDERQQQITAKKELLEEKKEFLNYYQDLLNTINKLDADMQELAKDEERVEQQIQESIQKLNKIRTSNKED